MIIVGSPVKVARTLAIQLPSTSRQRVMACPHPVHRRLRLVAGLGLLDLSSAASAQDAVDFKVLLVLLNSGQRGPGFLIGGSRRRTSLYASTAEAMPPICSAARASARRRPRLSGACDSAAWYSDMARLNCPRRSKICAAVRLASVLGAPASARAARNWPGLGRWLGTCPSVSAGPEPCGSDSHRMGRNAGRSARSPGPRWWPWDLAARSRRTSAPRADCGAQAPGRAGWLCARRGCPWRLGRSAPGRDTARRLPAGRLVQGLRGDVDRPVRQQVAAEAETILVVGQGGQLVGLGACGEQAVEDGAQAAARFGDHDLPFQQDCWRRPRRHRSRAASSCAPTQRGQSSMARLSMRSRVWVLVPAGPRGSRRASARA
jgi:hypothetical protein